MWIAVVIAAIVLFLLLIMFNSLIAKKNQVENAFSTIDSQLKKRYDLIPNLVATVKGYAKHEATILKEVTDLRGKALSGGTAAAPRRGGAKGRLSQGPGRPQPDHGQTQYRLPRGRQGTPRQ